MNIFAQIAYYQIVGLSLNFWLGILSLVGFLMAAPIPYFTKKKIKYLPFSYHRKIAGTALAIAIIHGLLGLISYL